MTDSPASNDMMRFLRATPEFEGLEQSLLAKVASKLTKADEKSDAPLIREDEPQTKVLILGDKSVAERKKNGAKIDSITGPACIGLLHAFRDEEAAFATVTIESGGEACVLASTDLRELLGGGVGLHLLGVLSDRLRVNTKWMRSRMADQCGIQVAVFDSKPYDKEILPAMVEEKNADAPSAQHLLRFKWLSQRLSAETASAAMGCQVVCIFVNDSATASVIEQLAKFGVKMIALRCAGYNNVDLEAARAFGIEVCRVPAYSPFAVAEHAVALIMCLNRKLHRAIPRTQQGNFSLAGLSGFDMHSKTVGVLGTGRIGQCAIDIFRGFGMKILAYDKYPCEGLQGVTYMELEDMLPLCDIVSIHCPLLPATHHLLNEKRFKLMKKGAMLINTSRGAIVDTTALIASLKSGHLGSAGLDVYDNERNFFFEDRSDVAIEDDQLTVLTSMPTVVMTSHQAFLTREALHEIARVTLENIITRFWEQNVPANLVQQEYK